MNNSARIGRYRLRIKALLAIAALSAVWINALWLQEGAAPDRLARQAAGQGQSAANGAKSARLKPAVANLQIRNVQQGLKTLGFYGGEVDGIDGPKTQLALIAYQKAHGFEPTGRAEPKVVEHLLMTSLDMPPLPEPPPLSGPAQRVRAIQTALAQLGYNPGDIDGVFGDSTSQAIRKFERARGLPVKGEITETLLRELSAVSGLSLTDGQAG